jgi:hypothetical protein
MELPPVLQLISSEIPPNKLLPANIERLLKDKGFLKEISAQARFSVKQKVSCGTESSVADDGLKIYPTAALNPLSGIGKCNSHNCRVIQAESFARSIGLYCDHAVLTDFITQLFLAQDISKIDARQVFADVQAFTVLMPMVRAGIIRFSDPIEPMCPKCCKEITGDLSEKLWELILKDGTAEFVSTDGGKLSCLVSSRLYDVDGRPFSLEFILNTEEAKAVPIKIEVPFISRKVKIKNLPKKTFNLVKERATNDLLTGIRLVSEEAKSASDNAAVLVTNSRQDAVVLRKIDSGSLSNSFDDWERLRSVNLPWVSNLSVEEIIQLRERASKALPKFRDRMNKELFSISAKTNDPDKLSLQVARSLREEANELDAELSVAARKTGHSGHLVIGTTGISCIVYGIGAKDPTAIQVGATLTAALAAMYHPSKNAHADHAQLKTKPAYVLLSAREIIRNRNK